MRVNKSAAAIAAALWLAVTLTACVRVGKGDAERMAASDVPKVREAIAGVNGNGLTFTVTAEASCSGACIGVVAVNQTAGELVAADVTKLHEALIGVELAHNVITGNSVYFRPLEQYRRVGFEAGFCVSYDGAFAILHDPDPECFPSSTDGPSPTPSNLP